MFEKGEKEQPDSRLNRPDSFWDLNAMMPQRKPSPPTPIPTTVEITIEQGEGETGSPIPQPDPQRLAKAKAAMQQAQKKFAAKSGTGFPPDAQPSSVRSADRDREYSHAQQVRRNLEFRLAEVKTESSRSEPIPPVPSKKLSEPLFSYVPTDNPLLCSVSVYALSAPAAHDPFQAQVEQIHTAPPPTSEPPAVDFDAVLPTYSAMTPFQQNRYLWWREQVRAGRYPPIPGAYIHLYACELINLTPTVLAPQDALTALCALWEAYRECDSRLNYLVPEWIIDLCLLYQLPFSASLLPTARESAIRLSSLQEFFLGSLPCDLGSPFANAVLRYGCNYRFRSSSFRTEENAALFDTHIPAAFLTAFTAWEAENRTESTPLRRSIQSVMVRRSFVGSSFTRSHKYRIDVTFLSCSKAVELRFIATDLVKYCENQVRRMLGIKSRFHTVGLDPTMKSAVDAYFAPLLKKHTAPAKDKTQAEAAAPPAWDALYEARSEGFSPQEARKLEQSAWSVTRQLVDAFSDDPDVPSDEDRAPTENSDARQAALFSEGNDSDTPSAPPESSMPSPASDSLSLVAEKPDAGENTNAPALIRDAFSFLLEEKKEDFLALAKKHRMLPLTLAEQMNEHALDVIGDIAVDCEEDFPRLISDYKEDIKQWLNL